MASTMKKSEIVHYFPVPECEGRLRICICNTSLDNRSSRFFVYIEKRDNAWWTLVEGTHRGSLWSYEEAEKLAKGMYKVAASHGTQALNDEILLSSLK
jgi:hypothetical protein